MSEWKTDNKEPARCFIDECPSSKEAKNIRIMIEPEVWRVIVALTKEVKLEWQAFLCGTELNGVVSVTGYWIPKQKVTGASVENLDIIDAQTVLEKRLVASIHSHADMTVFHSGTDMESTCKSNWIRHHITVNNKLEYAAKSQHILACGKIAFIKAEMFVVGEEVKTVIDGLERIEKPTYGAPACWGTRHADVYDHTKRSYDREQDDFFVHGAATATTDPHVSPLHMFNRHNAEHAHRPKGRMGGLSRV